MIKLPDYIQEMWFDACCENIQVWLAMGNIEMSMLVMRNNYRIINRGMQESQIRGSENFTPSNYFSFNVILFVDSI